MRRFVILSLALMITAPLPGQVFSTPGAGVADKGTTDQVHVNAIAPDYVFSANYKLHPLHLIESYINENKHLPEIPSGEEMEVNGLNLKQMNLLLLKEIALYVMTRTRKTSSCANA